MYVYVYVRMHALPVSVISFFLSFLCVPKNGDKDEVRVEALERRTNKKTDESKKERLDQRGKACFVCICIFGLAKA